MFVRDESHVVITGGEPLLYDLWPLVQVLVAQKHCTLEVETNGTLYSNVDGIRVQFNISPKLYRLDADYVAVLYRWAWENRSQLKTFKFVVGCREDYEEACQLVEQLDIPDEMVVLQPLGTTPEEVLERTRQIAKWLVDDKKPYRVIPRLHILLYGNRRGT